MKNNILWIFITTGVLLMIPYIAMFFTDEVNWDLFDFIIMGLLFISTGLMYEFILKRVKTFNQRVLVGLGLFIIFILIWGELAVGLFGTPFAGN